MQVPYQLSDLHFPLPFLRFHFQEGDLCRTKGFDSSLLFDLLFFYCLEVSASVREPFTDAKHNLPHSFLLTVFMTLALSLSRQRILSYFIGGEREGVQISQQIHPIEFSWQAHSRVGRPLSFDSYSGGHCTSPHWWGLYLTI